MEKSTQDLFRNAFGTPESPQLGESLDRIFGAPEKRAGGAVSAETAPRQLMDLKLTPCNWTKEDTETLNTVLVTWMTGAVSALELTGLLTKVGKKNCPPQVWREGVETVNKVLDTIEPLSKTVNGCITYAAKLALLEMSIIRVYDAVDDWNFARELRTELSLLG